MQQWQTGISWHHHSMRGLAAGGCFGCLERTFQHAGQRGSLCRLRGGRDIFWDHQVSEERLGVGFVGSLFVQKIYCCAKVRRWTMGDPSMMPIPAVQVDCLGWVSFLCGPHPSLTEPVEESSIRHLPLAFGSSLQDSSTGRWSLERLAAIDGRKISPREGILHAR
jgi:hypothetical protein